jgi:hypothetical protein
LITGKPIDWPDYKMRVGQLKGLKDALSIARDINADIIGIDKNER